MDKALVSIAMASYNGEKFITEQIMSIVNQTYKNIEIVIVDDGSSDNTVNVIQLLQKEHPFIHLHLNESNLGVTQTFDKAVSLCKGEFIALSDQDDVWMNNKIETLVNAIGDYDAVYGNSLLVDEEGRSLGKLFSSMMHLKKYKTGMPFLLSNTIAGHSILMKTEFVRRIQPFPKHLFFDLWIGFNAAASNGIRYVDEVLVHYRQHSSNVVGTRLSANKRKRPPVQEQFEHKKRELQTLATAPIKDQETKNVLATMLKLFNRRWSLKRSIFFFSNFNNLLQSKQKPYYRKVLYCMKMFFKPNF